MKNKVILKVMSSVERTGYDIDGSEYPKYELIVSCEDYQELPNDANVRDIDTSNIGYKSCTNTLETNPKSFCALCDPIKVICSEIKEISENIYELTFDEGEGIADGGHRQQSIIDLQGIADLINAKVILEVNVKNFSKDSIAKMASSSNTRESVKPAALIERIDGFEVIKQSLPKDKLNKVAWKSEKSKEKEDIIDVLAKINLSDISLYRNSEYKGIDRGFTLKGVSRLSNPMTSSVNKSKLFKDWSLQNERYSRMFIITSEWLDMSDYIQINFNKGTNIGKLKSVQEGKKSKKPVHLIFSDVTPEYFCPKQLHLPVLSAYRANIALNKETNKFYFIVDNKNLLKRTLKNVCLEWKSSFKDSHFGNINDTAKDKNMWNSLYTIVEDEVRKMVKENIKYSLDKAS